MIYFDQQRLSGSHRAKVFHICFHTKNDQLETEPSDADDVLLPLCEGPSLTDQSAQAKADPGLRSLSAVVGF